MQSSDEYHAFLTGPLSREMLLRARALYVLGFTFPEGRPPVPDKKELQYRYHCAMLVHHPDASHEKNAHEDAACINEAYSLLMGRIVTPALLLDEKLVRRLSEKPIESLEGVPTYEEWLASQFYDIKNKSIWSW